MAWIYPGHCHFYGLDISRTFLFYGLDISRTFLFRGLDISRTLSFYGLDISRTFLFYGLDMSRTLALSFFLGYMENVQMCVCIHSVLIICCFISVFLLIIS